MIWHAHKRLEPSSVLRPIWYLILSHKPAVYKPKSQLQIGRGWTKGPECTSRGDKIMVISDLPPWHSNRNKSQCTRASFLPCPALGLLPTCYLVRYCSSSQRQADLRAPATRSMPGPLTQSVQFFLTLEGDDLTPVPCQWATLAKGHTYFTTSPPAANHS